MPGIPTALDTDTEDVTWALQTADALWKRNERVDALVWLRRAAQAAGDAQHDDRALQLAHHAAELAESIAGRNAPTTIGDPFPSSNAPIGAGRSDDPRTTQTDEVEEVSIEIGIESVPSLPDELLDAPEPWAALRSPARRVPSAAEKHAGILDPWAEGDARGKLHGGEGEAPTKPFRGWPAFDAEEVVTSAPPIARPDAVGATRRATPAPAKVDAAPPSVRVDLSTIEALSDLPDDAREAFGRAAVVRDLARDEEIGDFALALILQGSFDLTATIVDTPAHRFEVGGVVRARGTIDQIASVRLVAASETGRAATWDERAVMQAFRTCPWVENDLRAAGDRLQALVGVTMGPLGERLDRVLRDQVTSRLTLRVLATHEVFAARGKPIPGLLVVGAGELEFVDEEGAPERTVLRAGDFLFPQEVLRAAPAPSTARAAKGGALVLFADRHAAQELLVTCPSLLEIFAGM